MKYLGIQHKELKIALELHKQMNTGLKFAMDNIKENPSLAIECIREARKERINLERMATSIGITYGDLIDRIDLERTAISLGITSGTLMMLT